MSEPPTQDADEPPAGPPNADEPPLAATTDDGESTTVAIACQGGGSHTAYTAGFLEAVLDSWDGAAAECELVGISGTSGGAFNAAAVWYGLVSQDASEAVSILDGLWSDLVADGPVDAWTNAWVVGWSRMEANGFPVFRPGPSSNPAAKVGQSQIASVLDRHIDFEAISDLCSESTPELVVGTVDVSCGTFDTFTNEEVTPEAILASTAIPKLYDAVEIDGRAYWDGLFSQNPPIEDLFEVPPERKPDELWVIQINPQARSETPSSAEEIADRRNELAGNLSLNQELRFIERVNGWIADGTLSDEEFSPVEVHRIELGRELGLSSKLDRRPSFIEELRELGRKRAAEFLERRRENVKEAVASD